MKVAALLPRIARADSVAERYGLELEALAPIGAEIVEVEASDLEALGGELADADAIITSWGVSLGRATIQRLERCVVIGVGSIGVDMVDVEAATEAGIVVTNVPDVFIEEVADHTIMLLLAAARRTKEMGRRVAEGEWWEGRSVLSRVPRLWGQTLGLVSFGNVARAVARRARPFGLRLLAYDPYLSELAMTRAGVEPVALRELLERSDFVSLHAPLNDETRHLIAREQLSWMRPTAVLINTARGGIVDERALIEALDQERLAAAALDVMEVEPPPVDHPLRHRENVVITPHVASASTRMRPETRRRVGREVALALTGRWPMSCVNPTVLPRVELRRWQPYAMDRGPNR